MSLSLLILSEFIVLLLALLLLSGLYIRKQKKLLKKQLEALQQIKVLQEERTREYKGFMENHKPQSGHTIADFLTRNLQDSQARYETHAQAKLPKIDPNQAFSAKVAALRFLYLTAEKEVYDERGITHAGWNLFERKLADIVRWFGQPAARRQEVRSNRTRLLQERIDALKPFEEENKTLQRRLEQSHRRQKQLEAFQRESRETIKNLQKLIATLQAAGGTAGASAVPVISDDSSLQMDSIAQLSHKKAQALRSLQDELNLHQGGMPSEAHKRMESSIKMMEIELIKSDRYIASLQKELKEAKTQAAIIVSRGEKNPNDTGQATLSPNDYMDRQKVMSEIHQLRENNRLQRGLIVKLEQEIGALKGSLLTVDDEETRKIKQAEVNRLERLVKDCQNCIETLESQVDSLYSQLRDRDTDAPDEMESDEEFDTVGSGYELEAMASEMENIIFQYRQSHALNRLVQEIFLHQDLDSIAAAVVQFLTEFQAAAGFCLRSSLGALEYFPDGLFDENQRQLMCSFSVKEPVFYLNESTLFSTDRINLMLLPVTDAKPPHESVVLGLVKVVDAYIAQLEAGSSGTKTEKKMDAWVESTKNQLADLDIQYAYQLEENKKAFNNFMTELRQSYHLLDLKGSGLVLLDNAINEYEQRMYLIMDSGNIIDREITRIVNDIDQWQHQ